MAKGNPIITTMSGKVGNVVAYTSPLSKASQIVRVYQPNVANPKTIPQANQRMVVSSASTFYSLFQEILDHSFQGKKVGGECQQRFMALALQQKNTPFTDKGANYLVPGIYQISEGSINPVSCGFDLNNESSSPFYKMFTAYSSSIIFDNQYDDLSDVSLVDFLEVNPNIKVGDQITLVTFHQQDTNEGKRYFYILNRGLVQDDGYGNIEFFTKLYGTAYGPVCIKVDGKYCMGFGGYYAGQNSDLATVACAVIISRWDGLKWLRSSATLSVSEQLLEDWYSDDRYQACLASYRGNTAEAGATDTDKYLNDDGTVTLQKKTFISILYDNSGTTTPVWFLAYTSQAGVTYGVCDLEGYALDKSMARVLKPESTSEYFKANDIKVQFIKTSRTSAPSVPWVVSSDDIFQNGIASASYAAAISRNASFVKNLA